VPAVSADLDPTLKGVSVAASLTSHHGYGGRCAPGTQP
jgi:hypothetical protein